MLIYVLSTRELIQASHNSTGPTVGLCFQSQLQDWRNLRLWMFSNPKITSFLRGGRLAWEEALD
jgi:hypothetical protein